MLERIALFSLFTHVNWIYGFIYLDASTAVDEIL